MRVQLIKESSGFGYTAKIVEWLTQDEENIFTLNRLQEGQIVELPSNIAPDVHNLVNIETGTIVSKMCILNSITVNQVKELYGKNLSAGEVRSQVEQVFKIKKQPTKLKGEK